MKKIVLCLIVILAVINIQGQDLKRYQIKSGIIEYKIEGNTEGTETLYFDDYGKKEAKRNKIKTTMMGFTQETDQLIIMKEKYIYTCDYKTNVATKMENPSVEMMKALAADIKDMEKFGEEWMKQLGGKKVGEETVNGKNCDVWEIAMAGSKTWVHKAIPLKMEVNMMGMKIKYTATKVELNASVPGSKFEVPAGFKIQDGPDMNKMMKDPKKMQDMMKKMMNKK